MKESSLTVYFSDEPQTRQIGHYPTDRAMSHSRQSRYFTIWLGHPLGMAQQSKQDFEAARLECASRDLVGRWFFGGPLTLDPDEYRWLINICVASRIEKRNISSLELFGQWGCYVVGNQKRGLSGLFDLMKHCPEGCRSEAFFNLYGVGTSLAAMAYSYERVHPAVADFHISFFDLDRNTERRRYGQDGIEQLVFSLSVHLFALSTLRGQLSIVDNSSFSVQPINV